MAQTPPDQNFYHHPHTHSHSHTHPHPHPHPHSHSHPHSHPQLQLPPQFRNPFDLLFDDRASAINYNYIRPYIPNQLHKPDDLSDSLVMRRPRRTRTTFTSAQIAELEQHFLQGRYLTSSRLAELSAKLALGTAQVKIWFKNRRRRHKIQSDQQKDHSASSSFSCDGMPLSPSMPNVKSEIPPSLQALTLACNGNGVGSGGAGGSGGGGSVGVSTPATLTPSPTPTTPTASLMDHYSESFNQFYYNNHHSLKGPPPPTASNIHPHPHAHGQQYPTTNAAAAAAAVAQFYPHAHSHHHQLQQEHQLHHQQQQQQQQQQSQQTNQHHHQLTPQGQYNSAHHHQYGNNNNVGVGGAGVVVKEDPDYNFNNPYYMRMSSLATPVAASVASANVGNVAVPAAASDGTTSSAMSPNSEVYEPLTPKNDESPSLCNGGVGGGSSNNGSGSNSVELADRMDESNPKSLQVLIGPPPKHIGRGVETCANINSIIGANESAMSLMEECTGAFSKYSKLASDIHETTYQCTMDTIMHAYNSHRSSSSNTQFAYCFN